MWIEAKQKPISGGGTVTWTDSHYEIPFPTVQVAIWPPRQSSRASSAGYIVTTPGAPLTDRDRVRAALVSAGVSSPPSTEPVTGKLTPERRDELARRLSDARPMSDLIREEREGR